MSHHFRLARGEYSLLLLLVFALTLFCVVPLSGLNIRNGYESGFDDPEKASLAVMPLPRVGAKSTILFEVDTGTILYERDADLEIPPASLTKLVVFAIAFDYLSRNHIPLSTEVPISSRAWASNAPPRSSLMFLGPEEVPTWNDLLLGLAVDSGNDAAIAIAEAVDGSVDAFVADMNAVCQRFKLTHTRFVEPSGYSEKNMTSARDYAYFIWRYMKLYPEAIPLFHSVQQFTYPHAEGTKEITQKNGIRLLFDYPGADGLKTGYIDESGYNLAFTARNANMRVAGIMLGAQSDAERFGDARDLLNYAFEQYTLSSLEIVRTKALRIWKGSSARLQASDQVFKAVLPNSLVGTLKLSVVQGRELLAPIEADTVIGYAEYGKEAGRPLLRFPILSGKAIGESNFVVGLAESAYLGFRSLFRAPWPAQSFAAGH